MRQLLFTALLAALMGLATSSRLEAQHSRDRGGWDHRGGGGWGSYDDEDSDSDTDSDRYRERDRRRDRGGGSILDVIFGRRGGDARHAGVHRDLDRQHVEWHRRNDRLRRDRRWEKEHDRLHKRLDRAHREWHRRNDRRSGH